MDILVSQYFAEDETLVEVQKVKEIHNTYANMMRCTAYVEKETMTFFSQAR